MISENNFSKLKMIENNQQDLDSVKFGSLYRRITVNFTKNKLWPKLYYSHTILIFISFFPHEN